MKLMKGPPKRLADQLGNLLMSYAVTADRAYVEVEAALAV